MNRNGNPLLPKFRHSLIQIGLVCAVILQILTSHAQPVTQVATGYDHSLFLKSDGSVWAMGYNASGQLGNGVFAYPHGPGTNIWPAEIVASNVTTIAVGSYHSLLLMSDGGLWVMGSGEFGQLGDGTFNDTNRPEEIVASNVVAMAGGGSHTLFLNSDGSLWAMGMQGYGQLGDGSHNENSPYYGTNQPEQIVASNVTAIAAGYWHSLFIKSDGSLWGMGYNGDGELGDGTWNDSAVPEKIVASNVVAIAAGAAHSLFVKKDGSLWAMGAENSGQLGDGVSGSYLFDTNNPEQIVANSVVAVAAGDFHSLFFKVDGSLWGMGDNSYGQLGDNTYNGTNRPEQIVAGNVKAVACFDHSMFVKTDGSLWGMGYNYYGNLEHFNKSYSRTRQTNRAHLWR